MFNEISRFHRVLEKGFSNFKMMIKDLCYYLMIMHFK
jgi:hypothetical protein